ncbi:hypothetical protein [Luteibacter sp. SG786]|uniref:hypothetical protein n=1 Tax=Luteibacter sp. SG786 TaxID=2587130 RepID=UPI00141D7C88|nr:hypothetical protein [Luteibacter sp. SG786]NII54352.1 hypothetical protein [Luteibacter sp. SG786]
MSMTVEQAFDRLRYFISPDNLSDALEAISVLRSHIEREVDEAMVERAAKKHMEVRGMGMLSPWETCTEETRAEYRKAMKAALIAAMEGK